MTSAQPPAKPPKDRQVPKPRGDTGGTVGTGILPAPGAVHFLVVKAALFCPHCGERHVEWDGGDPKMRWERRAHTTHRCRKCGGDFDVYVCGASDDDLNERYKVVADNAAPT